MFDRDLNTTLICPQDKKWFYHLFPFKRETDDETIFTINLETFHIKMLTETHSGRRYAKN